MDNEGTVAPKERVNIVYKSESNGLEEDIELPLKVMILGEYSTELENIRVEEKNVIDINENNFNSVMESQKLNITTHVKNKLEDNNDPENEASLSLSLDFKNIKDFEPDKLINNVPELKKLYELRETLKALKGPLGNIPEFRKKLQTLITDENTREKLLNEIAKESEEKDTEVNSSEKGA
jgi:type VI secretion system protein ImpB